jgi:hypothetical protein
VTPPPAFGHPLKEGDSLKDTAFYPPLRGGRGRKKGNGKTLKPEEYQYDLF